MVSRRFSGLSQRFIGLVCYDACLQFEGLVRDANLDVIVAKDTILGLEKTESRKRGRTVEDVATAISEGLRDNKRREKQRDS